MKTFTRCPDIGGPPLFPPAPRPAQGGVSSAPLSRAPRALHARSTAAQRPLSALSGATPQRRRSDHRRSTPPVPLDGAAVRARWCSLTAYLAGARTVLAARDVAAADRVAAGIRAGTGNAAMTTARLDLLDRASIDRLVA